MMMWKENVMGERRCIELIDRRCRSQLLIDEEIRERVRHTMTDAHSKRGLECLRCRSV